MMQSLFSSNMRYPKVSIIVVNFNQVRITLNCLKSLSKISYPNYEIIVIDNNSSDNSAEVISRKYPKIKLLQNTSNLGYAGGNNTGLEYCKGKYILILNNDTKVTSNFLEPLVEDMLLDKKLGIVQSKILVMDNPKLLDNVISFQTITGFLYHKGYLDKDGEKYRKFLYSFSAKGACILINKKILKLGLFDDDFFAYFEETDLCWRSWLLGFKVGFEPKSIIYHKMGVTSAKMNRSFIHYHSFKNRIRTILKNAEIFTLIWMLPIHITLCLTLAIYFIFTELNGTKSILRAFWWNLLNLPETLRLRSKIQYARKISDSQIFRLTFKNPPLSFYLNHLSLVKQNLKGQ